MASEAVLNLLINLAGDAAEQARGLGEQIGGLGPIAVGAGLAVGGALVVGLGQGLSLADEAREGVNQLEAQLGLTRDEAEQLGDVGVAVFGGNWYSSIEEATAAVGTMKQTLGGVADISEEELKGAAESAAALKDVFGVEVPEAADAAATLMNEFGLSSDQAFDFLSKGFQSGLDRSGDFLDTIGEYSVQFSEAGHGADDFFSILETGSAGGVLGTDKIADAFKESRIRIAENTDEIIEAYKSIGATFEDNITTTFKRGGDNRAWADEVIGEFQRVGVDAEQYRKQLESGAMSVEAAFGNSLADGIAKGSVSIADAQKLVIDGLGEMDNGVRQNAAGIAIFGTQWEDAGAKAILGVDTTKTSLDDLNGATDSLNAKYNSFGSLFGGAWRMIQTEVLLPVGETLLGLANEAMPAVQAATTALGDAIQWVKDNSDTVLPVLAGIGAAILVAIVPAFWSWAAGAAATGAANLAAIAPLLPVIAAVGLAVGLLYAAWSNNWGGIQEKTAAVWSFLSGTVWPWLVSAFDSVTATLLPSLQTAWSTVWGAVQGATTTAYTFFSTVVWPWLQGTAWPWIVETALPALQTAWSTVWGAVQSATSTVYTFLKDTVWAWLSGTAWPWLQDTALPAMQAAWQTVWPLIQGAVNTVYAFLKDTVWPWLRDTAWPWLKDTALPALQMAFSTAWGAIQLAISAVYTWWKDTFYPWLETTFNNFKEWMANLKISWETNVNLIKGIIDGMSQAMRTAKDDINTALDRVKELLESGWDTVKSTVFGIWSTIGGYISGPIESAQGIVDQVVGEIKGVVQGGLDLVNSFIDAVNSIPGVPDLPNIPGRAMGGPVLAGMPYMVGERGPELIVPQRNGYVYTADQTRGLLSGGGSDSEVVDLLRSIAARIDRPNYTIHGNYPDRDRRAIGDDLRRLTLMGSVS